MILNHLTEGVYVPYITISTVILYILLRNEERKKAKMFARTSPFEKHCIQRVLLHKLTAICC